MIRKSRLYRLASFVYTAYIFSVTSLQPRCFGIRLSLPARGTVSSKDAGNNIQHAHSDA